MNLEGKAILITGASSGIGEGCAYEFAKEKSLLALTGRNWENLENVKKKCIEYGLTDDQIILIKADMKIDDDVRKIVPLTIEKFGKLDVLVNNAGVLVAGTLEQISMENYDEQMLINTRAPLLLTKTAIPHLRKVKGNIVNVSSICGLRAFSGIIAYTMSKAAMDMMTQSLALELASAGVRVNAVNPGVIKTNAHLRAGYDNETYLKFLEHSKTTHALGRTGEVKEVADVILFFASDKSSFITGQLLPIDGGRGVMCPR